MRHNAGGLIPAECLLSDEHVVYLVAKEHCKKVCKPPPLQVRVVTHVCTVDKKRVLECVKCLVVFSVSNTFLALSEEFVSTVIILIENCLE